MTKSSFPADRSRSILFQGRCNDHGGMIYLFTHDGKEIDGVYQAHPIRIILADSTFGRLWALNPMENNVYSYTTPTHRNDVRKCLQEEEIVLDLSDESFEPSTMIQSKHSLGLIDTEHDAYRLYAKDDSSRLIATYQNTHQPQWKITGGVIFQDNRTLLKLTEDRYCNEETDRTRRNPFSTTARRRLIELDANGEEKRQIQADALYSLALGECGSEWNEVYRMIFSRTEWWADLGLCYSRWSWFGSLLLVELYVCVCVFFYNVTSIYQ